MSGFSTRLYDLDPWKWLAIARMRAEIGLPWEDLTIWVSQDLWDAGFGLQGPPEDDRKWGATLVKLDPDLKPRTLLLSHEFKHRAVFGQYP